MLASVQFMILFFMLYLASVQFLSPQTLLELLVSHLQVLKQSLAGLAAFLPVIPSLSPPPSQ